MRTRRGRESRRSFGGVDYLKSNPQQHRIQRPCTILVLRVLTIAEASQGAVL